MNAHSGCQWLHEQHLSRIVSVLQKIYALIVGHSDVERESAQCIPLEGVLQINFVA